MGGDIFVFRMCLQCLMLIKTQGQLDSFIIVRFPPLKYKCSERRRNYKNNI